MHIGELRPKIGDFAMRMAFLVSKKVLFLAWQGAAKPMLRCNDNLQQSFGWKQPVVAVKVATQRLKPLRGGESVVDAVESK